MDQNIASPFAWKLINVTLGTCTSVSRNIGRTVTKNEHLLIDLEKFPLTCSRHFEFRKSEFTDQGCRGI